MSCGHPGVGVGAAPGPLPTRRRHETQSLPAPAGNSDGFPRANSTSASTLLTCRVRSARLISTTLDSRRRGGTIPRRPAERPTSTPAIAQTLGRHRGWALWHTLPQPSGLLDSEISGQRPRVPRHHRRCPPSADHLQRGLRAALPQPVDGVAAAQGVRWHAHEFRDVALLLAPR